MGLAVVFWLFLVAAPDAGFVEALRGLMATFPIFSAALTAGFTRVFAVDFGWLFGGFFGEGALVGLAGACLALGVFTALVVIAFLVGFSVGFATTLGLDLGFFEGLAVDTF